MGLDYVLKQNLKIKTLIFELFYYIDTYAFNKLYIRKH